MYVRSGGEDFAWADQLDVVSDGAAPGPSFFLNSGDRGGTSPTSLPSFTVDEAAAQLNSGGYTWNDGAIATSALVTYAFRSTAPATMPNGATGFSQFNAQQIAQTELSLQAWSDVANISFVRVGGTGYSNDAQMLFANFSGGVSAAGFAYSPGTYWPESGDVWINSTLSYNAAPQLLNYGRLTLAHEIGHAIGLDHPHEEFGGVAGYYEDSRQYSVMSYFSEATTAADFQGDYAAAPLLDDIAAAQRLYGANMTTRTGNTTYGFNSNANRDYFLASSASTEVIFAVWDAGGIDTLDFSGYADNQHIELRAGYFSHVGGLIGNVTIAMGAVIERAIGGSGADTIIGNSAHNLLDGRGGADAMQGLAGNDTYIIDNIGDTVIEASAGGNDLVKSRISYTLSANVERLTLLGTAAISGTGNALANVIIGNSGGNTLTGGGGNDTLNGGAGADSLVGGTGNDTYIVDNVGDVVTEAARAGYDTVRARVNYTLGVNVENLTLFGTGAISGTGNSASNTLTGNSGANVLRGSSGADKINGGGGGDSLYGGVGADTLTGGAGADKFYFDVALSWVDKIRDFTAVDDSIYLSRSIFSAILVNGTLSASAFRAGTAAADADDRIIYDSATGKLYYDADGNGAGAQVLFAQLVAGTSLTNVDLIAY